MSWDWILHDETSVVLEREKDAGNSHWCSVTTERARMGWDKGASFKKEGRYIAIADSCCCMAETNTIL